ncbi:hypothetical protein FRAHR75_120030 [Frankia sp. Hr75.2]|nr:hypothetical protein FRAHR75_120030 [Frankia sp. Hr75.2]SQD96438.1 hypothetical protein FMEAI12_3640061 [Parafrankia sp. Ea1.12]
MSGTADSAGREVRLAGAGSFAEGFFPFLRPRLAGLMHSSLQQVRRHHAPGVARPRTCLIGLAARLAQAPADPMPR